MGHRIGYIRVSSGDQQPARQLDQVSVDRVFTDYASGKDVDRPQLAQLLAFVRSGDTVVVHSLDRLARNLVSRCPPRGDGRERSQGPKVLHAPTGFSSQNRVALRD